MGRGGVRTGKFGTKSLTLGDYEAIKEHVPLVTNVTPQADTRVQVVYGNQNWGTSVRGVGPEYLALKNWNVVRGGMYTNVDVERANNVCVLGQTIVDQLFGSQDPIGETIRVKNEPCLVVGVLDVKGQSATGQDQDDNFLMPYTTVMKKIKGQTWLDDVLCSATSAKVVDQAEQDIAALMRDRHHIRPGADDDFNLRHPTEIAEAVKQSGRTDVKVTGLSLPNMCKPYVKEGVIDSIVLWNTVDLGYLTVYAADALSTGALKRGDAKLAAGRLGQIEVADDEVRLGAPFVFNKENIDRFNF